VSPGVAGCQVCRPILASALLPQRRPPAVMFSRRSDETNFQIPRSRLETKMRSNRRKPDNGVDHPMAESRRASRLHVSKAGTIKFVGGGTIDCMVLNVSSIGASLKVSNPAGIPERFILVVPGDGLHRSCCIVWRKALRIGVTFG
jgi:hypothetical protein